MKYIESPSFDPAFNLALEQYVFDQMDKKHEYFMLWQNANTIVVGKHQNTIAEINTKFVEENDIKVVRRLSGGGAVYHDLGNLNFTFIVDGKDISAFDFGVFCRPVIRTLERLGVPAMLNGRNDMTIEGKKFSGNSQYLKKGRIMHHGTVMYDCDLDMVDQALKVPRDKIESKGFQSVRSRVTNVKDYLREDISLEAFKGLLLEEIFKDQDIEKYHLTDSDVVEINNIRDQVYTKWDWNYGVSPEYNILKERRIDGCGKLELYLMVEKGVIDDINFYGDFFCNGDLRVLREQLVGHRAEKNEIRELLENIDINQYFNQMKNEDFLDLLFY